MQGKWVNLQWLQFKQYKLILRLLAQWQETKLFLIYLIADSCVWTWTWSEVDHLRFWFYRIIGNMWSIFFLFLVFNIAELIFDVGDARNLIVFWFNEHDQGGDHLNYFLENT